MKAKANAEKRLFISLLTRDIPLVAAFLDIIDNSVNAAIEPYAARLQTAADYVALFNDETVEPTVEIKVETSSGTVTVTDNAAGISATTAAEHVFKFGRDGEEAHRSDRLSVYGIGLKRAMFKMGNRIVMSSDHVDGGFDLVLDVAVWEADKATPWTFEITEREPSEASGTGTTITITELYPDVVKRIGDGVFQEELRKAAAEAYSFFLAKFVTISIDETEIEGSDLQQKENRSSKTFEFGNVSYAITAGLGTPEGGKYRAKSSGWFVFCNGRAVISADKTALTGWGNGNGLPTFQPKHRPFSGTVFFVSTSPDELPWTTTKSAINEDSEVWQQARREMGSVGRKVITFLDNRYTDDGTEIDSKELQEISSGPPTSVFRSVATTQTFSAPVAPPASATPPTSSIQFDARKDDIKAIAKHFKSPSMSNSQVGRKTFEYFLKNQVGED